MRQYAGNAGTLQNVDRAIARGAAQRRQGQCEYLLQRHAQPATLAASVGRINELARVEKLAPSAQRHLRKRPLVGGQSDQRTGDLGKATTAPGRKERRRPKTQCAGGDAWEPRTKPPVQRT